MTTMTSREFSQDVGRAKREANDGPVYIADRGQPSHVLLSFDEFKRMLSNEPTLIELLAGPDGVEDVEFEPGVVDFVPRPAHWAQH